MTFEIDVNGQTRAVSIESVGPADHAGGRFRITIQQEGAVTHDVDARRTDLGVSMVYLATGTSVDAALVEYSGGEYLVQLRQVALSAFVDGRRSRRDAGVGDQGKGAQRVTAPMPGRVVRVLVAPGDDVIARQALVVIEAMKMENELAAVRAGRVVEVAVTEGASVEAGRLLVRLE